MKAKTLDFGLGLVSVTLAVLIFAGVLSAFAQGTAFTYQGRLQEGAIPANGSIVIYNSDVTSGNSTNGVVAPDQDSSSQITYIFSTLAGASGEIGSSDGIGTAARFHYPEGVVATTNLLYVSDHWNHTIRKITKEGLVSTIAGSPGTPGSAEGKGQNARFNFPSGVAVDSSGNIIVADTYNHSIRKIASDGAVTTLAGKSGSMGSADGSGKNARFSYPRGVAVDRHDNIYVADTYNQTIRRIDADGNVITVAGKAGVIGSTDGQGSEARFNYPRVSTVDSDGTIFIADVLNNSIRKITPSGQVTTWVGSSGVSGGRDAVGSNARFNEPFGVAIDTSGNAFVADTANLTIRKISAAGNVTTIGGLAGQTGSNDGPGVTARFNQLYGIAVDTAGILYVTDYFNNTIRKGVPSLAADSPRFDAPSIGKDLDGLPTIELSFVVSTSGQLTLETSSDLAHWIPSQVFNAPSTNKLFSPFGAEAKQFYRLVLNR